MIGETVIETVILTEGNGDDLGLRIGAHGPLAGTWR